MLDSTSPSLIAVRTLLHRTPDTTCLPGRIHSEILPFVESYTARALDFSMAFNRLVIDMKGGKKAPELMFENDTVRQCAVRTLRRELDTLHRHVTEIVVRLARAGELSRLDDHLAGKLVNAPDSLAYIRRKGGVLALLASVTRQMAEIERFLDTDVWFSRFLPVSQEALESFIGDILAVKLVFRAIVNRIPPG